MSDDGVTVPEHVVPWPAAISEQARQILIALNANAILGDAVLPDPRDPEAWQAYVATVNEALLVNSPMYGLAEVPGIVGESTTLGGVRVHIARPESLPADDHRVYLEIHGGGMVLLEGEGCRRGGLRVARDLGVRVVSVDYRVPPDHPYPAALDDCVAVYAALLDDHRPADIVLGGISGGGNLAAAAAMRIRDEGLPLPAGLVLLTPEVDLTESGDTFDSLVGLDPVLNGRLSDQIVAYAPDRDLTHPYLSPIFADFTAGYPPTFLQSGTRDMFLSNTVRMHRALRKAGVAAELHVWDGMPHGGFQGAPEDAEIVDELRRFLAARWDA